MDTVTVGQVFKDQDRGRLFRVIFIATPESHSVKKATAVCRINGKLTCIAVERLLTASRYEHVPQEGEVVDAEVDPAKRTARFIYLPKAVTGDGPFQNVRAEPGVYERHENPHGAVFVQLPSGTLLGIKPGEFIDAGGVVA